MALQRSPNRLLSALSAKEYGRITDHLHTVWITSENQLPYCGVTRLYFPGLAACSIQSRMSDGSSIEVGGVGSEGVVGLPALGAPVPVCRYIQIANGAVEYMTLSAFQYLSPDSEFGRAVDRYASTFVKSMMHLAACNGSHTLEERYARWILLTHERLGRARFELTQPLLTRVLGAPKKALREVTSTLADRQILAYDRSSVTVLDTIALKRATCGCYRALKNLLLDATSNRASSLHVARSSRVLQMRPANLCTLCGLVATSPHISHSDCLRAIDREVHSLIGRARVLGRQRLLMTSQSLKKYEKFRKRQSS